jgi:hypothetical protein
MYNELIAHIQSRPSVDYLREKLTEVDEKLIEFMEDIKNQNESIG